MKRLKHDKAKVTSFIRGGKLQGLGTNTSVLYTGNRNRRGRKG